MAAELRLQDILAVENDPELLGFKCPDSGFLLWPLVRVQFLRCILSDLLYETQLMSLSYSRNYRAALPAIARAAFHNLTHRQQLQGKVMLIATGAGNALKNGRWFNRLSDHFALAAASDTVVVEDLDEWRWPYPRHNQRVLIHTPLRVYGSMLGRLFERNCHRRLAERLIAYVRARAKRLLGWELGDQRAAFLIEMVARHAAAIPMLRRAYERLFARTGARLVIKEDGCYGHSGIINRAAKDFGLVVAEYQHGAVSAGHDAYNLAAALAASDAYRRTLPDFFLGYGTWWNNQIDVPLTKIAIGNPHRSEQLVLLDGKLAGKSDVLILGDGIETELYLGFARRLASAGNTGLRVVFRPHPMERSKVMSVTAGGCAGKVHIDQNKDIYESFCTAHAVVSEVSTGLFEAAGLADRVFIWDTPKARFGYPTHPFAAVSGADDLAVQIKGGVAGRLAIENIEGLWAPNWRANYLSFIRDKAGA